MNCLWRIIALSAFIAAGSVLGCAQTVEQPMVLTMDMENYVQYRGYLTDATKMAQDPGLTTGDPSRAWQASYLIGDIVALNGKPAKGLQYSATNGLLQARVSPQRGQSIADFDGQGPQFWLWEILDGNGNWVGTLVAAGGALPAPSNTILAGNGAFLGVTGERGCRDAAPYEKEELCARAWVF
jgi:hypothetical protein